jgi:putative FmdB family regulatory protein
MPIFEYECSACGERFEQLVRSPQETGPAVVCPRCGGQNLQQLQSLFAVNSADTRRQHWSQGRRRAQKDLSEQKRAEMEAVIRHHNEHD